ncbi:MAG: Hsp20/alpha crystallin family protein [Deltaproteobacteria bacterium]|nr:MAG: Hsp20/alpha crystallin family protein [Deltaproteobacteria bacterium]
MRALVPRNPFQELTNWHRDIDDLFNRFFRSFLADEDQKGTLPLANWLPVMEAFEKDGRYVIRMDLPGVDPKEVELSVVEDSLIIKGERKKTQEVKEKDYHYSETAHGRFERSLALPKGVDKDKITARYEHGVLEISMPLPEEAVAKNVPIEVSGSEPKQLRAA